MKKYPSLVSVIVLLFCAWQGRELWSAWGSHQHFALGSVAFAIWIIPALLYFLLPSHKQKSENLPFLYLAIILSTIGVLGTFNAFRQLGVAFAISGFVPLSIASAIWVATSAVWMSLFAYFMSFLDPILVTFLRLTIAALGAAIGCCKVYQTLRNEE